MIASVESAPSGESVIQTFSSWLAITEKFTGGYNSALPAIVQTSNLSPCLMTLIVFPLVATPTA